MCIVNLNVNQFINWNTYNYFQKCNILSESKNNPQQKYLFPTCLFKGVDEKTIIDILVKRSNDQRQQIREAFQHSNGKVILSKKKNQKHRKHPRSAFLQSILEFIVASGISTKERPEGRSGGCGVGTVENTSSVWCPAAQTGYEGTNKCRLTGSHRNKNSRFTTTDSTVNIFKLSFIINKYTHVYGRWTWDFSRFLGKISSLAYQN